MKLEKKVKCRHCRKVIGVLKDGLLEIQCDNCGAKNLWDAQGKRVRITGTLKKDAKDKKGR